MWHWLETLPTEVGYGLATALALAAIGWVSSKLRRTAAEDRNLGAEDDEARPSHPPPVPRQLPRAPMRFVNRKGELDKLDAILEQSLAAPGPTMIVLDGMHGVGKSAIGSRWAHLNRERFPDGDLFGDFSTRRQKGSPDLGDILGDFLKSLGTPGIAIPVRREDKEKLFARLTAERRLLIFLDDVDQASQVLTLLPSGPGCVVLATTNFLLEELLREGARRVKLQPLDTDESSTLLEEMCQDDRPERERDASLELIEICEGLPVSLCVCGARLAANPTRSVSWLVAEIAKVPHPLRALSPEGSFQTDAVFDFAYRDLSEQAALLYRRLGFCPRLDLVVGSAAALAGRSVEFTAAALEDLYRTHLIDMPSDDRYRSHALIQDHMSVRAELDESGTTREEGLHRLVDWYYAALRNADRAVVEDRLRLSDDAAVRAEAAPEPRSASQAFQWYEKERQNVMVVLRAAAERGWDQRTWQYAEALWPLCANRKHFPEWIESQELAIVASLRLRDRTVEARMRSQLARAFSERGEFERAEIEMTRAEAAVASSDNERLKASVVEFGGVCRLRAGDLDAAISSFEQAMGMFEACGSKRGTALQEYHLGWALVRSGRFEAALAPLESAALTMEEVGDPINVGRSLVRQGEALSALGRLAEAQSALTKALDALAAVDIWLEQGEAHEVLAEVSDRQGDPDEGLCHRQKAYRIYREHGHPRADALLSLLDRQSPSAADIA